MFTGSINRHLRAILAEAAAQWGELPVYVACSGNFTVERILATRGAGPLHSNDVSIYSCAVGWHLAGRRVRYRIRDPAYAWLSDSLRGGPSTIATLLLVGELLRLGGPHAYGRRIEAAYRRRWPEMHAATVRRVRNALRGVKLAEYFAGDCRAFLAAAPSNAVCVSFPPTYRGGYERLYSRLDEVFDWPKPQYDLFGPEDLEAFGRRVREFRHWLLSSDAAQPALSRFHVATVQVSAHSKPVFVYADKAAARVAAPQQRLGPNPWAPRNDEAVWPIEVVPIRPGTMNTIRSQYLGHGIVPCDAPRNYAVLSAGRLIGAFAFALPRGPLPCDVYLLSDFAVRPSPHRRLSKLVLAVALSREVQADLEQWLVGRIRTLATTAFTDAPVSMKYRGLLGVHSRGDGKVNYLGNLGRWSLLEAFGWWRQKHSTK